MPKPVTKPFGLRLNKEEERLIKKHARLRGDFVGTLLKDYVLKEAARQERKYQRAGK